MNSDNSSDGARHFSSKFMLFLSVDIVNSTSFKQQVSEQKTSLPRWVEATSVFYQSFHAQFFYKWHEAEISLEQAGVDNPEPPVFWKAVGDEILFTKSISHAYEVLWTVVAWIEAVHEVRKGLQKFNTLDLKASAWTAGFPVTNWKVTLPRKFNEDSIIGDDSAFAHEVTLDGKKDDIEDFVFDYIGPSIDVGFRLGSLATPRKMPVSIELAYILAKVVSGNADCVESKGKTIDMFYEGRVPLKGVLNGVPYPVFWLDISQAEEKKLFLAEDHIAKRESAHWPDIIDLCEQIFNNKKSMGVHYLDAPYIVGDKSKLIPYEIPEKHKEKLKALEEDFKEKKQKKVEKLDGGKDESRKNPSTEELLGIFKDNQSKPKG